MHSLFEKLNKGLPQGDTVPSDTERTALELL